jgi:hypothetical protein
LATISDKKTIDSIITGNGIYPGDEDNALGPVVRIVEYTDIGMQRVWGIVYLAEAAQGHWSKYMAISEYIYNPEEYWRHPDVVILPDNRAVTYKNRM